jgi:pimeloyl-ACP methyl ester carboxylesterase
MHRVDDARSRDDLGSYLLSREGLDEFEGAGELEGWFDTHPSPELALVLAEQSYWQARALECRSWGRAIARYRDAGAYASIALEGMEAIALRAGKTHNAAVARLLVLAQKGPLLANLAVESDWLATLRQLGVSATGTTRLLAPDRIGRLVSADEFRVSGFSHHYGSDGLGVPLVALWPQDHDRNARASEDRYFPDDVATPATAVLRAGERGTGGAWHGRPLTLILYDPFDSRTVEAGGQEWPLAADRTTALAVQVNRGRGLRGAAISGVVASDLGRFEEGLYLLRPYQPGKIPVVLVHGLLSSPLAWAETYNELCNDSELADHYQFWIFLYATGEPIPVAAAHLRETLREAMATFDPSGSDPALRQMVVVGHSMGGLLTKILAQDSGLTIWNAVVNVPYPASRLAPESRALLERALIFRPEPYVRRLVFIATPHGGSPVADGPLGRLGVVLSRPQGNAARIGAELEAAYGPGSYNGGLRGETFSLRNLSPSSRVIQGLRTIPVDPGVPHHSIVLQLTHHSAYARSDGLVPYESAHFPSATSEMLVPGFHVQVGQQGVTDELRRILRIHLEEVGADLPIRGARSGTSPFQRLASSSPHDPLDSPSNRNIGAPISGMTTFAPGRPSRRRGLYQQ